MRLTKIFALAGLAVGLLWGVRVQAAPLQWEIDSAQSSIKLAIPDQKVNMAGTAGSLRVRNQNNSTWTTNVAALSGSLSSDYVDGTSIQFLSNPLGQFVALNSGSYRPNPAAFNPANTNADNPDGRFDNTSAAPAVFGGKLRLNTLVEPVDIAMFSVYDVSLDLASGVLPLNVTGQFAANGTSIGITQGTLALDGPASIFGQPIPDSFEPLGPIFDGNWSSVALVTSPDPINQPLLRRLQLPFNVPTSFELGGVPLAATLSGTVVAYAMVPEPSSALLAGLGAAGLFVLGSRRRKRRSI